MMHVYDARNYAADYGQPTFVCPAALRVDGVCVHEAQAENARLRAALEFARSFFRGAFHGEEATVTQEWMDEFEQVVGRALEGER